MDENWMEPHLRKRLMCVAVVHKFKAWLLSDVVFCSQKHQIGAPEMNRQADLVIGPQMEPSILTIPKNHANTTSCLVSRLGCSHILLISRLQKRPLHLRGFWHVPTCLEGNTDDALWIMQQPDCAAGLEPHVLL